MKQQESLIQNNPPTVAHSVPSVNTSDYVMTSLSLVSGGLGYNLTSNYFFKYGFQGGVLVSRLEMDGRKPWKLEFLVATVFMFCSMTPDRLLFARAPRNLGLNLKIFLGRLTSLQLVSSSQLLMI